MSSKDSVYFVSYIVFFIVGFMLYLIDMLYLNPVVYKQLSILSVLSVAFFILSVMCGSFEIIRSLY